MGFTSHRKYLLMRRRLRERRGIPIGLLMSSVESKSKLQNTSDMKILIVGGKRLFFESLSAQALKEMEDVLQAEQLDIDKDIIKELMIEKRIILLPDSKGGDEWRKYNLNDDDIFKIDYNLSLKKLHGLLRLIFEGPREKGYHSDITSTVSGNKKHLLFVEDFLSIKKGEKFPVHTAGTIATPVGSLVAETLLAESLVKEITVETYSNRISFPYETFRVTERGEGNIGIGCKLYKKEMLSIVKEALDEYYSDKKRG